MMTAQDTVIALYVPYAGTKGQLNHEAIHSFFYDTHKGIDALQGITFDWDQAFPQSPEIASIHKRLILGGYHRIMTPTLETYVSTQCVIHYECKKPRLDTTTQEQIQKLQRYFQPFMDTQRL